MATTIHIPSDLLDRIDQRAQASNMSRNRFIVVALRTTLDASDEWHPGFIERLRSRRSKAHMRACDEMLEIIKSSRSSKHAPPKL